MPLFEAKVRVKNKNGKKYSSFLGMHVFDEIVKMFHIPASNHKQAVRKAKNYGDIVAVRKVHADSMGKSIEQLDLSKPPIFQTEYVNAISMEEMIWQRRKKRVNKNNGDKGIDNNL